MKSKEELSAIKIAQLRETWVKNIMGIQGKTRDEAETMYLKIDPYKQFKEDEVERLSKCSDDCGHNHF